MLKDRSGDALQSSKNQQRHDLLVRTMKPTHRRTALMVIAGGLLSTVLALFAVSKQLPGMAEESNRQQAEKLMIGSIPSNTFCLKALQGRPPYVCAHGGDTSSHPPNTAAAYAAALVHTYCIEIDATLTADHQLVSLHGRELEQLLRKPGAKVEQYSLRALQLHDWPQGHRVLTVQQALAAVLPHAKQVVIDVKADAADKVLQLANGSAVSQHAYLVEQLLQLMAAHKECASRCLIWGKADRLMQLLAQGAPGQLAGYVVMRGASGWSRNEGKSLYSDPLRPGLKDIQVAAVHHNLLNAQLVSTLQSGGKAAYAWTADEPAELQRLLDLGLDGIVTNRPALLSKAVNQRMLKCSSVQQKS